MNVSWPVLSVLRVFLFEDGFKTLRTGHETSRNVYAKQDQRSKSFAKPRSHFKNERVTVVKAESELK